MVKSPKLEVPEGVTLVSLSRHTKYDRTPMFGEKRRRKEAILAARENPDE